MLDWSNAKSNGSGPDRSDSGHGVANPYGNLELVNGR